MEQPAPMYADRYALLSGRRFEDVFSDLTSGRLASTHDDRGTLMVATSAVTTLFAKREAQLALVVSARSPRAARAARWSRKSSRACLAERSRA